MFEQIVDIERIEQLVSLFGNFDENIKRIEKEYRVSITSHGGSLKISGDAEKVSKASRAINALIVMINKGETINSQSIDSVINMVEDATDDKIIKTEMFHNALSVKQVQEFLIRKNLLAPEAPAQEKE